MLYVVCALIGLAIGAAFTWSLDRLERRLRERGRWYAETLPFGIALASALGLTVLLFKLV